MSERKWTTEQMQAIKLKGANILVSAGAGSGKTSVLVERIVNKIINDGVDIDKILVVTFTNAAASEMRQRLMDAIYKKIDENPNDDNLQRQLMLINKANISTIHSFCLNVIRNNFFEIGISNNFRVADSTEIEIMKQEVVEDIFDNEYESQNEEFTKLLEKYTTYNDDSKLKELILRIYEFIQSDPFPDKWLQNAVESYNIKYKENENTELEQVLLKDKVNLKKQNDTNTILDFSNTNWGNVIVDKVKETLEDCKINLESAIQEIDTYSNLIDFISVLKTDLQEINQISITNFSEKKIQNAKQMSTLKPQSLENDLMEQDNNLNAKTSLWDKLYQDLNSKVWQTWPRKSKMSEEEKEAKERAKSIRDLAKANFAEIQKLVRTNSEETVSDINAMYTTLKAIQNLVLIFEKEFEKRKREKNIVDFNDIEHLALKILVDDEGNPTEIAKKYDFNEIEIDEYQDSNSVQEYILNSVSNGHNIFMVGDVKQSIYKFRQANPKLFMGKYNEYNLPKINQKQKEGQQSENLLKQTEIDFGCNEENDSKESREINQNTKICLYKNFRSRKNILDITNLVFNNIMSKKLGEIEYTEEEALNLGANFEESSINCETELNIIETNDEICKMKDNATVLDSEINGINETFLDSKINGMKNNATILDSKNNANFENANSIENNENEDYEVIENATLEARLVAKKIKELNKLGQPYKNITILLRSPKSVATIYEKELMDAGIPVFSDITTEYLNTIEIDTVMSVLKIIDNPLQDIPFVTVLRSEIGGFTDNELIEIRLVDRNVSYYRAFEKAKDSKEIKDELKEKIAQFINLLKELREEEKIKSLDELIWDIYNKTGYYHYVGLMPDGTLRQANLKKLFEKAREYEKISLKGLFNFILFMEKVGTSSGSIDSARIIGENDDVVRIMSIHKSKGLEFPIVFLCNSNKKFNLKDMNEKIVLDNNLGIGANYIVDEIEFPTIAKDAIRIKANKEAISEEMRVLYVALTRAKEKLIIVGTSDNVEKKLREKVDEINKYYKFTKPEKLNPKLVEKYKTYLDWIELVYKYNDNPFMKLSIINKLELMSENKNKEQEKIKKHKAEIIKEINEHKINKEEYEKINQMLNYKYKYENDVELPTKTSVTALKELINSNKDNKINEKNNLSNVEKTNLALNGKEQNLEQKTNLIFNGKEQNLAQETNLVLNNKEQNSAQEANSITKIKIPSFAQDKKISGARRGTIVHLILSKITNEKNVDEVNNLIEKLVAKNTITEEEKSLIDLNLIKNYLNSELYNEILQAKEVNRETPFYLNINSNEIYEKTNEPILVQGVIDIYYISKNDELVLVDYKTDYIKEIEIGKEELTKKYKSQLDLYKRALEKALKKKVDKAYIYSTSLNECIEI